MDSSTSTFLRFPLLKTGNYPQWAGNMKAWFMRSGTWKLVNGEELRPAEPAIPATVSAELQAKMDDWDKRAMKAAGELYLLVSDDQKTHLEAITGDPVAIWKKLASIHLQQRPAARFNAYDTFFSIQKAEDESLTALMTRVDQAMLTIQNLRPAKFDIAELDKELTVMTLIRALPSEYSTFASSLQLIENLDKEVQSAFINEELLRTRTTTSSSSTGSSALGSSALGTAAGASLGLAASTPVSGTRAGNNKVTCDFCGMSNHSQASCYRYKAAQSTAVQDVAEKRREGRKRGGKRANNAVDTSEATANTSNVSEYAGKAGLRSNALSSTSASVSDNLWTADTGATSHMTPHRHWLRNYKPCTIPVRLANNQVIQSAGIGTMVFAPRLKGGSTRLE